MGAHQFLTVSVVETPPPAKALKQYLDYHRTHPKDRPLVPHTSAPLIGSAVKTVAGKPAYCEKALAQIAFTAARREAQYEHGHGGYTGTIAEKGRFVMVPFPEKATEALVRRILTAGSGVEQLLSFALEDPTTRRLYDDKWGPACCLSLGTRPKRGWPKEWVFVFFGLASS